MHVLSSESELQIHSPPSLMLLFIHNVYGVFRFSHHTLQFDDSWWIFPHAFSFLLGILLHYLFQFNDLLINFILNSSLRRLERYCVFGVLPRLLSLFITSGVSLHSFITSSTVNLHKGFDSVFLSFLGLGALLLYLMTLTSMVLKVFQAPVGHGHANLRHLLYIYWRSYMVDLQI